MFHPNGHEAAAGATLQRPWVLCCHRCTYGQQKHLLPGTERELSLELLGVIFVTPIAVACCGAVKKLIFHTSSWEQSIAQELHSLLPGLCASLGLVNGGIKAILLSYLKLLCIVWSLLLLWVGKTKGDKKQNDAFHFWLLLVFLVSSGSEYTSHNL